MPNTGRLVILKLWTPPAKSSSGSLPSKVGAVTMVELPGLGCALGVRSVELGNCSMPKFWLLALVDTTTTWSFPFGLPSGVPPAFSPVVVQPLGRLVAGAALPGTPWTLLSCST